MDEDSLAAEASADWIESVSLSKLAEEDAEPSHARREVLALEAAIKRLSPDIRGILENELNATFREVRPYRKPSTDSASAK